MKVNCPNCGEIVPAEGLALDTGWGKCTACHEVFRLADVIEGYVAPGEAQLPGKPERPFDAWAVVERQMDRLLIHIPPHGLRAGTLALLGFAIFWLGFVAFWTAGALGLLFGGQVQGLNIGFACFSMPFWLVGFGMLGGVLWASRGSRTVYFDGMEMVTELRCLLWRRRRVRDLSTVQHARESSPMIRSDKQGSTDSYLVEIVYSSGSFVLPCSTRAEQQWLIAEINDYLKSQAPRLRRT